MTAHDDDRDELAAVLALAEQLPAEVVAEVALAYDLLCDPVDPPRPPRPATVTEPGRTLRAVHARLMATADLGQDVHRSLTLGMVARHLGGAIRLLDRRADHR